MKLRFTLFGGVILLSMGLSPMDYAQSFAYNHKHNQVSADVHNTIKLRDALLKLKSRHQINLIFEEKILDGLTADVGIVERSTELETTLQKLLQKSALRYEKIKKNTYLILPTTGIPVESIPETSRYSQPVGSQPPTNPVATRVVQPIRMDGMTTVRADRNVSGIVTDENRQPLPGVSVVLKGSQRGTTTDGEGRYQFQIPEGESNTLIFSFVGYRSQEIAVGNRSKVDVQLTTDNQSLSEVIVVGYGTQEKRDLTGSVASVKLDAIENTPVASVDNILQGKAAGVQIIQGSGAPGAGVTVRVRGNVSINRGNAPLYVIDGIPLANTSNQTATSDEGTVNPLADINPNDIESVEVLKDASASAIYGVRGGNGVVLITTKRGKTGKPRFSVNVYQGVQQLAKGIPFVGARENRLLRAEAIVNAGITARLERYYDSLNVSTQHDIDQIAEVFQLAPITNADLSVQGGTEKVRYALSTSYFNQEGIIPNVGFRRFSARFNTDYQATDRLLIGSSLSFSNSKTRLGGQDGVLQNVVYGVINYPPWTKATVNGQYTPDNAHPLTFLNNSVNNAYGNRLIGSVYGEFKLLKDLKIRSSIAIDNLDGREEEFYKSIVQEGPGLPTRQATEVWNSGVTWINENVLTYNLAARKHAVELLGGYSLQETRFANMLAVVSGAATDDISTLNAGSALQTTTSFRTSNGLRSMFGRVNYKFNDRYLFTFTVRSDASSRFGIDNRTAVFPSAAIGWRVSDEPFLANSKVISHLKFRASYGQLGNESGLNDFEWQGIYSTGVDYNGLPGIGASSLRNPNLRWEKQVQADLGVDIGFLNNRFTLTADAYLKRTNDLLFNVELPRVTGFNSVLQNTGQIDNRGLELALDARLLENAVKWSFGINGSFLQNRVVSLPGGIDITTPFNILRQGQPIGAFFLYNYQGVYATDEDVPTVNGRKLSANGVAFRAGDARFQDVNNDGIINTRDLIVAGTPLPTFTGGFNSVISYKGLELSGFFTFSAGNQILNLNKWEANQTDANWTNMTVDAMDRWLKPGDVARYPRRVRSDPTLDYRQNSTLWLENGDFLRLRTATLAYVLPKNWVNKASLSNVRVYVTGQNLLTWTNYSGWDPEVMTTNNRSDRGIGFGIDNARIFPQSRSVIAGLSITF